MTTRPPSPPLAYPAEGSGGAAGAPGAAGSLEDLLDRKALDALRELDPDGSSQLIPRVLQAFTSATSRYMRQVHAARESGDVQVIKDVAHTVKSSAANIGALQLHALCVDIELKIRAGDTAALPPRLDALEAEVARVVGALARLQDRAA